MVVLVTFKNVEGARVVTTLFIEFSAAQGQLTPKFKLIQAFMVGLVTCKNEEDPSKNDYKGQLTHKSLLGSCLISNPFKTLWLFSLPARIKKIKSKMKGLDWSQGFPLYNPMGAICCHGNQCSVQIWPKTLCSQCPTPIMLQMKFDEDWPAGLRDIHV